MLDNRVFSRRLHIVGYILQMYVDMPGPASPGAFSLKTIIRGLKNNRTPLFCTPYGLDLREANFKRIVDNKIEEYVIEKKTFKKTDRVIGLLLLLGLQEMFPCDGTAEYRK